MQCSSTEKAFDLLLQKSVLIHSLLLLFDLPNAIGNNCKKSLQEAAKNKNKKSVEKPEIRLLELRSLSQLYYWVCPNCRCFFSRSLCASQSILFTEIYSVLAPPHTNWSIHELLLPDWLCQTHQVVLTSVDNCISK